VTYAELLIDIDNAIKAILTGAQSYTIGTRSLSRANIAELLKWRKEIKPLADDEASSTSGKVVVGYVFPEC